MTDHAPAHGRSQRFLATLDGHRLRRLRHQAGLSQADLAWQAGISLTAVGRLERQPAASCRPRTLARLAAALRQSPACLTVNPQDSPPSR